MVITKFSKNYSVTGLLDNLKGLSICILLADFIKIVDVRPVWIMEGKSSVVNKSVVVSYPFS